MAVVLMLATPRARTNAFAFVLGWLIGLGLVGTVVLLAGLSGPGTSLHPATWTSWLKIGFGALLLTAGVRLFHHRPQPGDQARVPKWVGRIDHVRPVTALVLGAAPANPMNLLLAIGAAAGISQAGISGAGEAIAYAVFAAVGTLGCRSRRRLYIPRQPLPAAARRAQGLDDPVQRRHHVRFLPHPGRVALLAHD